MKRIVYLFVLGLGIGLVLIYLHTAHIRTVYRITCNAQRQRELLGQLWEQQLYLSKSLESPHQIKQRMVKCQIPLQPADSSPEVADNSIRSFGHTTQSSEPLLRGQPRAVRTPYIESTLR